MAIVFSSLLLISGYANAASLGDPCDPNTADYCGSGLACVTADTDEVYYYCADATSSTTSSGSTFEFANPINATSLTELLGTILSNLQGVIAVIAVVFIVIGGVMYMISAGDEGMIKKAKGTIGGALIGLAIALAAPTFLKELQTILGGSSSSNPDEMVSSALTVKDIALNVLNFLLSVVGIFGILGLVVGGAFYLTAYGDEDMIKKGKSIVKTSLIGIAIAFAALVIVRQIASLLGALK